MKILKLRAILQMTRNKNCMDFCI